MSEDYKKIALEDVKKGQRVRIVERNSAFTVTYEGTVCLTNPEWDRIDLGGEGDEVTIIVDPEPEPDTGFDIFLLEDAPKPKVVSIETVTVTRYDDGTEKTETVSGGVLVPMVIKTADQFEAYEEYFKTVILKDRTGRYWEHRHGVWGLTALDGSWNFSNKMYVTADNLPMTVVASVGD